jgi:hypothetical protein
MAQVDGGILVAEGGLLLRGAERFNPQAQRRNERGEQRNGMDVDRPLVARRLAATRADRVAAGSVPRSVTSVLVAATNRLGCMARAFARGGGRTKSARRVGASVVTVGS